MKVHPAPETLASVVPVWVASARDLANIQAAAESEAGRRFQFGLYSLYYPKALRQPWLHPLVTPWWLYVTRDTVSRCAGVGRPAAAAAAGLVGGRGGAAAGAQRGGHLARGGAEDGHWPGEAVTKLS